MPTQPASESRVEQDRQHPLLVPEEEQVRLVEGELFDSSADAQSTAGVIHDFVDSYTQHKGKLPLEDWLAEEFGKHGGLWSSDAERVSTAREIVATIQAANDNRLALYAHLDAGKSKESWLARKIEQGAAATGGATVAEYAAGIDLAIADANEAMRCTILNGDGTIGRQLNLDGFIAEQHHVDTFNIEAASQGSPYRARALGSNGKNSMDIGIYDKDGNLVRRYQAKYGQDADATAKLFDNGDYRGQRKLVPTDQVGQIEGATDAIEIDGIRSKPLTKEQAKALQERAQLQEEIKQYEWNEVNRIKVAKHIGKQALVGAAASAAFQGARIVGRRVWNSLTGRQNRPANEDLTEFFASSIKSGAHVGVQVAVTGAVVVAARNGWINVLKRTPASAIANVVYVGMENAKVLYKLARGELSSVEAVDAMGNVTCSAIGGIAGAMKGSTLGAALGATLGPVGVAVGGLVGAVVGGMAGSTIGEAIYEGGKVIAKTAVKVASTVLEGAKETVKAVGRTLNPFTWFA